MFPGTGLATVAVSSSSIAPTVSSVTTLEQPQKAVGSSMSEKEVQDTVTNIEEDVGIPKDEILSSRSRNCNLPPQSVCRSPVTVKAGAPLNHASNGAVMIGST